MDMVSQGGRGGEGAGGGAKPVLGNNRDLKQSGRQRQGRLRLKNEFLPLIRFSKMAAFVYRL